jgi:hypothetical protein
MKKYLLACIILLFAVPAFGADIKFGWDKNSEADLAGYRLFQRNVSGAYDYTTPVAEIPAGTEVCIITVSDGDYLWVLRAFDIAGNESEDSNECGLLVDDPPGVVTGFG